MSKFKKYFITNCISYTAVILFYTFLGRIGFAPDINGEAVLKFFMVTTSASVLIFLTSRLNLKNIVVVTLVHVLDIFIVVFVVGSGILQMFEAKDTTNIIIVSIMILLTYLIVASVTTIKNQADAAKINKKLAQARLSVEKGGTKND